jgi:nucleotide-binding universal stress UspA family protein
MFNSEGFRSKRSTLKVQILRACRSDAKPESALLMLDPSPYKTIAVASTFSPRFLQVLSEAKRIRERFSSDLRLIYVGEKSEETTAKFRDVLGKLSLPLESTIHYQQGDPVGGILQAVADNKIDMIVAGALEKEVVLHPFLGNVARRLVREASCSVMLFTQPDVEPKPLRRIVFVADYSDHAREALRKAFQLALAESCERLYAIRIITTFDQARASLQAEEGDKVKTDDDEEAELEKFVLSAGATEVPIEARCIRGNTGFAAADFVQSVKADLLVVPLPPLANGNQALPSNIAWITDVIPCNLWVIR